MYMPTFSFVKFFYAPSILCGAVGLGYYFLKNILLMVDISYLSGKSRLEQL